MNAIRLFTALLVAVMLLGPVPVRACPLCSEAIATSNEGNAGEDTDNFPTAMNQSIYLMLAVPYLSFGVVGWMIYRGVRKNDEFRQAHDEKAPDVDPLA